MIIGNSSSSNRFGLGIGCHSERKASSAICQKARKENGELNMHRGCTHQQWTVGTKDNRA